METQTCISLNEEQKLNDMLSSEKFLTGVYNTYCCEASTGAVKNCLMSILQDEHRIHEEIFNEINSRGWYPLEKAEDTKLNSTKQQFAQTATV